MADYHCKNMQELDDVHRLLPSEILKDIGIVDPAERQRLAVVEDLAMRLASVLGGAAKITPCHDQQVNTARRLGGRDVLVGGDNARRPAAAHFLPAPAGPPLRNGMVFHPAAALPGMVPATPLPGGAQATAMHRSSGTGVFLPRNYVEADAKVIRQQSRALKQHRRGKRTAMEIRKQKEMHAVAARMEPKYVDVHACQELALPQEWVY